MPRLYPIAVAILLAVLPGLRGAAQAPKAGTPPPKAPVSVTTPSGLIYVETHRGRGATPRKGDKCVVHYTSWLYVGGKRGRKIDSSVEAGQPFTFIIGVGKVIKGLDEAFSTMRKGGRRTLIIPPELAYGARGSGVGVIPPNASLIFDVELLSFE